MKSVMKALCDGIATSSVHPTSIECLRFSPHGDAPSDRSAQGWGDFGGEGFDCKTDCIFSECIVGIMTLSQVLGEINLFLAGASFGVLFCNNKYLPPWNNVLLVVSCLICLAGWLAQHLS